MTWPPFGYDTFMTTSPRSNEAIAATVRTSLRAGVVLVVVLVGMATSASVLVPAGFPQRLLTIVIGTATGFATLRFAARMPPGFASQYRLRRSGGPRRDEIVRIGTVLGVVMGSILVTGFVLAPEEFAQRIVSLTLGICLGFGVMKVAVRGGDEAPVAATRAIVEPSPVPSPPQPSMSAEAASIRSDNGPIERPLPPPGSLPASLRR